MPERRLQLSDEERRWAIETLKRMKDLSEKAWTEELKARDESVPEEERFFAWVKAIETCKPALAKGRLVQMIGCLMVSTNQIQKDSFGA